MAKSSSTPKLVGIKVVKLGFLEEIFSMSNIENAKKFFPNIDSSVLEKFFKDAALNGNTIFLWGNQYALSAAQNCGTVSILKTAINILENKDDPRDAKTILTSPNFSSLSYADVAFSIYDINIAKYLIEEAGIGPDYVSKIGRNILEYAAINNKNPQVFFYVLEKFPQLLYRKNIHGKSAFYEFFFNRIHHGNAEAISYLLRNFPYVRTDDGGILDTRKVINDITSSDRGQYEYKDGNIIHSILTIFKDFIDHQAKEEKPRKEKEQEAKEEQEKFENLTAFFCREFPALLTQTNSKGHTPFHHAFITNRRFATIIFLTQPQIFLHPNLQTISEKMKLDFMAKLLETASPKDLFHVVNTLLHASFEAEMHDLNEYLVDTLAKFKSPELKLLTPQIEGLFFHAFENRRFDLAQKLFPYTDDLKRELQQENSITLEYLQNKLFTAIEENDVQMALEIAQIYPPILEKKFSQPNSKCPILPTNAFGAALQLNRDEILDHFHKIYDETWQKDLKKHLKTLKGKERTEFLQAEKELPSNIDKIKSWTWGPSAQALVTEREDKSK